MKAFSWSVLIVFALVIGGFLFLRLSPDYNIYLMKGESMVPTLNAGDMIINGPLNGPLNGKIRAGTIVTYQQDERLITHRVLSINGETLVTKGDAAEDPDVWPVSLSDVKGTYLFKIPCDVSNFVQTKLSWFLVIIMPATLLIALLIKEKAKRH